MLSRVTLNAEPGGNPMSMVVFVKVAIGQVYKLLIFLLRWFFAYAFEWLIRPILEQSHALHIESQRERMNWEELYPGIRVLLRRRTIADANPEEPSNILIENASSVTLESLDFEVVATLGRLDFVCPVRVRQLKPNKIQHNALSGLPIEDIYVDDGQIKVSYESFYYRSHGGKFISGSELIPFESRRWTPSRFDLLNGARLRLFGRLWNMDAIREREHEIVSYLRWRLLYANVVFVPHSEYRKSIYKEWAYRVKRALCAIVTSRYVVAVICWVPLLLRIRRIEKLEE